MSGLCVGNGDRRRMCVHRLGMSAGGLREGGTTSYYSSLASYGVRIASFWAFSWVSSSLSCMLAIRFSCTGIFENLLDEGRFTLSITST